MHSDAKNEYVEWKWRLFPAPTFHQRHKAEEATEKICSAYEIAEGYYYI